MQTKIKDQIKKFLVPVLREIFYKRMDEKPIPSSKPNITNSRYAG